MNAMVNFMLLMLIVLQLQVLVESQDYAEYARGAGYGRRKNANTNKGSGSSLVVGAITGVLGSVLGSWLTSKKLKTKYDKDRKDLLKYIQLQDELYQQREQQWSAQYQKLYKVYEELEKDSLERDYDEFKAPDANNDDMISRTEFNTYVKKYLSSFPELSERDFPRFEEFDLNADGQVSFDEWQQFLYQQKLKEAQSGGSAKGGNSAYGDLMNALYDSSANADGFSGVNKNIASTSRGTRGRA